MHTQASDIDVLAAVAQRDHPAFMELYDRFAPRVFGLVMAMLKDRADAEDVLQECFWYIWRSARDYNPALGSPSTWILMIARSRALDRLRTRGRQTPMPTGSIVELASTLSPLGQATALHAALSQLPEDMRSAIVLAFQCGLTRQQIADVQGVPVGTVKTRIRVGLARLRESLTAERLGDSP